MANNEKVLEQKEQKLKQKSPQSGSLKDYSEQLAKYGGFDIIEAPVEKVGNLNPNKKAKRSIFLNESDLADRKKLKKRLELWMNLLASGDDIPAMINECEQKSEEASQSIGVNLPKP